MKKIHPGRNERPVSASKRSAREHQRPAVAGRSGRVEDLFGAAGQRQPVLALRLGPRRRVVVMALHDRVIQRHNSRELAHHLQRRGEEVRMAQLDDVEPEKRANTEPVREVREPRVQGPQRRRDGADTARRRDDCRQLRTTVEELPREHNIKRELGVPAEGWSPPADATSTCAFSASTTPRWGSPGCSNRRVTRKREDAAGKVNR